jgi:hypothetical protein
MKARYVMVRHVFHFTYVKENIHMLLHHYTDILSYCV